MNFSGDLKEKKITVLFKPCIFCHSSALQYVLQALTKGE